MKDETDTILRALLARYWDLLRQENIPHTPKLTAEADELQSAIRHRQPVLANEN